MTPLSLNDLTSPETLFIKDIIHYSNFGRPFLQPVILSSQNTNLSGESAQTHDAMRMCQDFICRCFTTSMVPLPPLFIMQYPEPLGQSPGKSVSALGTASIFRHCLLGTTILPGCTIVSTTARLS